jgi:hypothetical protein
MRSIRFILAMLAIAILTARPAGATFHLMQIEQVVGGVNGSPMNIQAIQLRMRTSFQNLMSNARLVVRDATGANPVILIAFPSNVANSGAGARVLVATSNFSSLTIPPVIPDFVLTNVIPTTYLAAGSLTYEDNFGTILWRLSWGGAGYTGPGTGALTNDADGQFDPAFAGPLPSTTARALLFGFSASAASTNNANDYALTTGTATFTNNAGASGTINNLVGVDDETTKGPVDLSPPTPDPVRHSMTFSVVLQQEARVQVRVLDIGGRVVRALLDETMPAGRRSFTWDASAHGDPALSAGIYFLAMNAGGAERVRRFVLIR